jgi:hypothetical protein
MDDTRYLEIGVWKGSTVCSAMFNNNAFIYCIVNIKYIKYINKRYCAIYSSGFPL